DGFRSLFSSLTGRVGHSDGKKMNKKIHWLALGAMLFALCMPAEAQQSTKIPRIGYLSGSSPSTSPARRKAFLQGLRELGYVEGKNIMIEWRFAEGKLDRLPALAAELVRLKVDAIFAQSTASVQAAKKATATVPIVSVSGDPVGLGLVA